MPNTKKLFIKYKFWLLEFVPNQILIRVTDAMSEIG